MKLVMVLLYMKQKLHQLLTSVQTFLIHN